MKLKTTVVAITFLVVTFLGKINAQNVTFEKSPAFLSQFQKSDPNQIVWGYLNVPETWGIKESKTIKIAVTVLKNSSNIKNSNAVVFLQGGPGASGIDNIVTWLDHPLRKNNDIVLFDVRGTGYSQPRLSAQLGKKFLEILAKNQTEQEDEKQKEAVAIYSKQDLINRKINIDSYSSLAVAEDLHALKSALHYKNWNVYGVSYGTYIAQVYASIYPEDVKSLLLDSAIYDISTYYVENTSNYINSLEKVFEISKKDKTANAQYPNLKKIYYEVIADLEKHPLTVDVDPSLITSGKFTYNAEDFKIAIQQALYNKQLVEIIPLLIYQFHERKRESLGNLVSAFSSLLAMDYGVYYCITCNETIPNNDYAKYEQNAASFKGLNGGISFYKSDFKVCNAWNSNRSESVKKHYDLSNLAIATYPVLVFSGEFDPITPLSNGKKVAARFKNAYFIEAKTYGHVPAFTRIGRQVAEKFINNSVQKPDSKAFDKAVKLSLVSGIIINEGVSKTGKSISSLDPVFLVPLLIALILMLVFIFMYTVKLFQNKYTTRQDKVVRIFITITSALGLVLLVCLILAIIEVSRQNFFVLAFGLPDSFDYIFSLVFIFIAFLILSLVYYVFTIQKTNDRSVIFTVIFSNILLATYLFYWGII